MDKLSCILHSQFLFWPNNGAYNLFAGNNPYSYESLKSYHNSEYSLPEANEWCGLTTKHPHNVSSIEYFNCTLKFILNDFLSFVKITIFSDLKLSFFIFSLKFILLFKISIEPAEGVSINDKRLSKVDFPDPDGPTNE